MENKPTREEVLAGCKKYLMLRNLHGKTWDRCPQELWDDAIGYSRNVVQRYFPEEKLWQEASLQTSLSK